MNDYVSLEIPLTLDMLGVVTSLVHQAAGAFGLGEPAIDRAVLATEEVFVYLVSHPGESPRLKIDIRNGGYFIRISFVFSPTSIPAHVLNISTVNESRDPESLEGLEIFIAGRIADRFIYDRSSKEKTTMHLIFEKHYPELTESPPPPGSIPASVIFTPGMNLEIKQAASRIVNQISHHAPEFFRFPGKVVDMVSCGDLTSMLATDGKGTVFGCIFWRQSGRLIDMYGPYLFVSDTNLGESLVRSMLETIGRSDAVSVINRSPTPDTPASWFEELPRLEWQGNNLCYEPEHQNQRPLYRELCEDEGTAVIVHSALASAVRKWYSEMFLTRRIIPVDYAGEHSEERTSFYLDVEKNLNRALITSCVIGNDAAETLRAHLSRLEKEGFSEILYEMDLSKEADAALYPTLRDAGFFPDYILPWGGQKDTMIFRYHTEI